MGHFSIFTISRELDQLEEENVHEFKVQTSNFRNRSYLIEIHSLL